MAVVLCVRNSLFIFFVFLTFVLGIYQYSVSNANEIATPHPNLHSKPNGTGKAVETEHEEGGEKTAGSTPVEHSKVKRSGTGSGKGSDKDKEKDESKGESEETSTPTTRSNRVKRGSGGEKKEEHGHDKSMEESTTATTATSKHDKKTKRSSDGKSGELDKDEQKEDDKDDDDAEKSTSLKYDD